MVTPQDTCTLQFTNKLPWTSLLITTFPALLTNCRMFSPRLQLLNYESSKQTSFCFFVFGSAIAFVWGIINDDHWKALIFIFSLLDRTEKTEVSRSCQGQPGHVMSFMQECRISKPCSSRSLPTCLESGGANKNMIKSSAGTKMLFSFSTCRCVFSYMRHQEELNLVAFDA